MYIQVFLFINLFRKVRNINIKLIIEYIKRYKITYIGIVIIFIVGLFIGVIVSFKTGNDEKMEIKDYIVESVENLKENKENKQDIFISTFFQNAKFTLIVWLLGCTIIAGFTIYFLMLYKGLLIGYIISIILNIFGISQGLNHISILLLSQYILFLPAIFLLATSGIRIYKGILKKESDLKYDILRHSAIRCIMHSNSNNIKLYRSIFCSNFFIKNL